MSCLQTHPSSASLQTCETTGCLTCSGNGAGHVNEVTVHRARLVLRRVTVPPVYCPTQPGHPSVAGAMSTGNDLCYRWGRNSGFCVSLIHVTMTAGVLITFRMRRRRGEMYIGHRRVCLSVCPSPHSHTATRTRM